MGKIIDKNDRPILIKKAHSEGISHIKINQSRKRKRKLCCNEKSVKKFCKTEVKTNDLLSHTEDFKEIQTQVVQEKYNEKSFTVNIKLVKNHAYLSGSDKISFDFFMNANSKHNHVNFINRDVVFQIFDEICLEGLDGITIEAFWKRLQQGLELKWELNDFVKNLIWNTICQNKDIKFFILKEHRPLLNVFDYYEYDNLDTIIEICMNIGTASSNIYPYHLIKTEDIVGSCATFDCRLDKTEYIRNKCLSDVLKEYGNRLVMVASQKCRLRAIFNESADPELAKDLQPVEYCILEMVGRNRKLGAISAGSASLAARLNLEAQNLFHHEKQLFPLQLIKKQIFSTKNYSTDQNRIRRLIHLPRFYKRFKSNQFILAEQIINILREMKDHRIDYASLKKYFSGIEAFKKLIRAPEFKKFVYTNMSLLHKDFYPHSSPNEWLSKNGSIRQVKIIELKDPTVNVAACWNTYEEDIEDGKTYLSDQKMGVNKKFPL